MARPCKIDTVHFRRTLSAAQRVQLLAAGAGCLSAGFNEILDAYYKLWAAGYRPGVDLQNIDLVINANENHSR